MKLAFSIFLCTCLGGCAVLAVADAAVAVGATVVKAGAVVVDTAVDVTSAAVKAATKDSTKGN